MRLYLIRHGDASPAANDNGRSLSPKGQNEMRKVAKFLKSADIRITEIFHSGLRRAEQTAAIIAETLDTDCHLVKKDLLAPNDSATLITEELIKRTKDLVIVGHMPHLSNLFAQLLTGSQDKDLIEFKKGAVVCLERDESQIWRIKWFVIPKIL